MGKTCKKTSGQTYGFWLNVERFLRSALAFTYFLILSVGVQFVLPFYLLYEHLTHGNGLLLHRGIHLFSYIATRCMPGASLQLHNETGEDFSKPAIVIANHQSMLDVTAVLHLAPRLVILTKGWVWKNPFLRFVLRAAKFYPAERCLDDHLDDLRQLIRQGYSIVVFPEGTRSVDGRVGRFHKGAFQLARELKVDILPLYLRGFDSVMQRGSWLLSRGDYYMEVGQRFPVTDAPLREQAAAARQQYAQHLAEVDESRATEMDNQGV